MYRFWYNQPMAITLYRRHSAACRVHTLNLPTRAVRLYTACECPIWICGRIGGATIKRESLGQTDWAAAEAMVRERSIAAKDPALFGPRLRECVRNYLAAREHELEPGVMKDYRRVLEGLVSFCAAKGIYFIRELKVDTVETWK